MRKNPGLKQVATAVLLCAGLLLGACAGKSAVKPSTWHLPWHRSPPAAPVPVRELALECAGAPPPAALQYWFRNALRVDLTMVSGSGTLCLVPNKLNGWPARIEFAVRAGSVSQLEVLGDQRAVFAIPATTTDGAPLVLQLAPSVYSAETMAMAVNLN